MATGAEVLTMLYPNGGWAIVGDDYEGITFLEAKSISKDEFETARKNYDLWKIENDKKIAADKKLILDKLGITEEEAKLLLG